MEEFVGRISVDILAHSRHVAGRGVTVGALVSLRGNFRAESYLRISKMVFVVSFARKGKEIWTLKLLVAPVRRCLFRRRC